PTDTGSAHQVLAPLACGDVQVERHAGRIVVPITGGAAVLTQALRELDGAGVGIRDVGLRRPTLDDVFLTLTGHAAESAERDGGDERDGAGDPEGNGAATMPGRTAPPTAASTDTDTDTDTHEEANR